MIVISVLVCKLKKTKHCLNENLIFMVENAKKKIFLHLINVQFGKKKFL